MKRLIVYGFLFISSLLFSAEKIELSIRYLGIPMVNVSMKTTSDSLQVQANSTKLASLAANMNNSYHIQYRDDFLPISYKKNIEQKNYREYRITTYDREVLHAKRVSFLDSTRNTTYPILAQTRDFFSALNYLRYVPENRGTIILDANKLLWKAEFKLVEQETINTSIGKKKCRKYLVEFSKLTDKKRERSDMLTNNLVDEDKKLYLWITKDQYRIPAKAKFQMSPFSVFWHLTDYENL